MTVNKEIEIRKRQLMKYSKFLLSEELLKKGINAIGFSKEDMAELIAVEEYRVTKDHFAKISGRKYRK